MTGVVEDNVRTFADHWYGTGVIDGVDDAEELVLDSGEYMISEVIALDCSLVEIAQNEYAAGDDVTLQYRTAATEGACLDAAWVAYAGTFASLGFVQVRVESTL